MALVLAVLFSGCAGGDSVSSEAASRPGCVADAEQSPLPEGALSCQMAAHVVVDVSGAEQFEDEDTYTVIVNEFHGGEFPEQTWFANFGYALPVDIVETRKYRIGFDLAPGSYRGSGTYELSSEPREIEGLESPLTDAVFLEMTILDPSGPGVVRYDRFSEPCTATLEDGPFRGILACPALASGSEAEVSLDLRWEPA